MNKVERFFENNAWALPVMIAVGVGAAIVIGGPIILGIMVALAGIAISVVIGFVVFAVFTAPVWITLGLIFAVLGTLMAIGWWQGWF